MIVSDCTDAFDDPDGILGMDHGMALKYEKYWYSADVITSDEVTGIIGRKIESEEFIE